MRTLREAGWDWKEHSSDFDSVDSLDTEEWQSWLSRVTQSVNISVHPSTVLHSLTFFRSPVLGTCAPFLSVAMLDQSTALDLF